MLHRALCWSKVYVAYVACDLRRVNYDTSPTYIVEKTDWDSQRMRDDHCSYDEHSTCISLPCNNTDERPTVADRVISVKACYSLH